MENRKTKSLKLNMMLNAIKGLLAILFPLISFPYVSRILGVETLGKYNFAVSIISYFILLSGLGINTYAVREGARCRDNKEKLNKLANQIFTINMISTIISYILLFMLIIIVPKFHEYTTLLIILSLQLVFGTIGIEWLYAIYEEYMYITVRSIIFQILSILTLFILVKTENDINNYAIITTIAGVGSNILNYIHSRHYCNIKFTKNLELSKHLKPILILFAMNITTTIYVSSDTTILGFLSGEYAVGIYAVSTKIYTIIKRVLFSILAVSIPRLASYLGKNDKDQFNKMASNIYKTLFTLVLPAMIGMILLNKEIILIVANESYMEATISLILLSISLIFVFGAYFWSQCVLIPLKEDKTVLKATIVSAIVNIVLNFVLIPIWNQNAAALTTIIAETIVFVWCRKSGKKFIKLDGIFKLIVKVLIGCLGIIVSVLVIKQYITNYIVYTIVSIITSVIIYGTIEILLKNDVVYSIIGKVKNRLLAKDRIKGEM